MQSITFVRVFGHYRFTILRTDPDLTHVRIRVQQPAPIQLSERELSLLANCPFFIPLGVIM